MHPVSVDVVRVKVLFDRQGDLVDLSPQPDDSIGQLVAEPSDSIAQSVTTPVHIIVELELQGPPRVGRWTNGEPQRVPDVSRRRWVGLSTECLRQLGERELTAGHDEGRSEVRMLDFGGIAHHAMIPDPSTYGGFMSREIASSRRLSSLSEPMLTLIADRADVAGDALRWQAEGLLVRAIRGRKSRSPENLFDEFAAALQFPSYFGENWDAFADCISDLDWLPHGCGIVVLIYDADQVLSDQGQLVTLVGILKDTAREFGEPVDIAGSQDRDPVPFHVVLQSDEPTTFGRWASAGAKLSEL